ncbi:transcriptional regulator, XRE family [Rhodovulum sp. PH10]|uniref:helix-turn-helix transcriptional regulator n=1 Tax=Rhodovulum sp. PH10 TaxID=1187851 RepID=UPI00027C26F2|nr:helix-turn-helix transcriptional regulator [Rhodovulum sp. PH10]EJW10178.1 transcriptional regulator, XRE family [Rhodovulum sp. PH10]
MKVRFETTPEGEMAIVPRAEYERLIALAAEAEEDAGTARLVDDALREIAAGAPLFPLAVANALADGENPIRVLRKFRGLTQAELAAASEIGQGYLSDLEGGKRKGPLELHQKIARALGVPLDLLAPAGASPEPASPAKRTRRVTRPGRSQPRR